MALQDHPTLPDDKPAADEQWLDSVERIGGHGSARDLSRYEMFDGDQDVAGHKVRTDSQGRQVIESPRGGLGSTQILGMDGGHVETAEQTLRANSTEFTAYQVQVPKGQGVFLLGEDVRRGYCRISNTGTDPVILGTIAMVNSGQGFILAAGQAFEPQTTREIYAVLPATAVANLQVISVWAERHP